MVQVITAPVEVTDDTLVLVIKGGTSAATLKLTATDAGEFCAPVAVTVTCPV